MDANYQKQVEKAWSLPTSGARQRWWQSETIIRHVNRLVCGEALEGWNSGPLKLLRAHFTPQAPAGLALSIGAGAAAKERRLLHEGLARHFDIFELSAERIRAGKDAAKAEGLEQRISFFHEDFFYSTCNKKERYDLVFWDNSLHHMENAEAAVLVSRRVLKPGGIFFCNDFVGPSRFQWSDLELGLVNEVRKRLPDEVFAVRGDENYTWARQVKRTPVKTMLRNDPSEAADSANILPAIQKVFPDAFIKPCGGLVYHLCLNDILENISEGSELLAAMLRLDEKYMGKGFSHYAFALAQKD